MRIAKSNFPVLIACFIAFGFFFVSQVQAQTFTFNYATFFPATHGQAQLAVEWGNEIEKRTNGRVKFTHFPGGALVGGAEIYDGIIRGITDVGMSVCAYTTGRFPATEAIDLPLGWPSGVAASRIMNDFYRKFQFPDFDQVKVMYLFAHGPGLLHSQRRVESLEDMRGLKVRATGTSALLVTALGAVPVAMPQGGTYEALQRGVAEATFGPIEVLKGWNQAEVIDYMIDSFSVAYTQAFFVAMNKGKWESLPKELQDIIEEVNKEWIIKTGEAWDAIDVEGREYSESLGNESISLSEEESARWAEAAEPVIEDFIRTREERGIPAREYIEWIRAEIEKYRAN